MVAPAASSPAARRSSCPAGPSTPPAASDEGAAQRVAAAERVRQRDRHLRHPRVHGAAIAPAPCAQYARDRPWTGRGEQQPWQRAGHGRARQEGGERPGQQQPAPLGGARRPALAAEPHEHVDEPGGAAGEPRPALGERGREPPTELDARPCGGRRSDEREQRGGAQDAPSSPSSASSRPASGPGPGRRSSPPRR